MKTFKYSEDLLNVGTKKALGYLPLETIEKYGGKDACQSLINWATINGYKFLKLDEYTCSIGSGALYVWDEIMVFNILEKYAGILDDANIPTVPTAFVKHILKNTVMYEDYPLAYIVIGLCYGDSRFKGRDMDEMYSNYQQWLANRNKRFAD